MQGDRQRAPSSHLQVQKEALKLPVEPPTLTPFFLSLRSRCWVRQLGWEGGNGHPVDSTEWAPWAPCVHGNLDRVTRIIMVLGQWLLGETVNFFHPWLGDTLLSF